MAMLYLRNKPIGAVSGGGSGGGHVIENASGTELAQRDTLKFGGYLNATDDSTGEKSVVSDAPNEVEYSVWQTMTDAQKTGKKWIIKNVPSSGSGGGHTIENSSGTDMAQRSVLQFTDADVADDSTNDRTEVSVVRKVTQAEYDELTPEEQNNGIIVITDANPVYVPSQNSVSVTADGVKTYSQLLNELYALVDVDKVTRNSVLVRKQPTVDTILHIIHKFNSSLTFTAGYVSAMNDMPVFSMIVQASGSCFKTIQIDGTTITDLSSNVPSSGVIFTLYYNIISTGLDAEIPAENVIYGDSNVKDALDELNTLGSNLLTQNLTVNHQIDTVLPIAEPLELNHLYVMSYNGTQGYNDSILFMFTGNNVSISCMASIYSNSPMRILLTRSNKYIYWSLLSGTTEATITITSIKKVL